MVGADLLNRHYFLKEVSDLYELIEIYKENIPQQKKTTNMLNSKRGKAVKSEQVFYFVEFRNKNKWSLSSLV